MRINTSDQTLKKDYIQVYQYLIKEYEEIKRGATLRSNLSELYDMQVAIGFWP